jgi:hypothetical protein
MGTAEETALPAPVLEQPLRSGPRLTVAEVVADTRLIQEVMEAVMIEDVHYGTVEGCGDKPMLFKAGAEKIATTFRLALDPIVEDLSTADAIRYRVTVRATHVTSGHYMGSGVGECSSDEAKYKWRKAVCAEEFQATPEDRRRHKYYQSGATVEQVRTEPADIANTVLKMAKKRAAVDCALTCTAASDCFGQDLEDLPEEVREAVAAGETPETTLQKPKKKKKTATKPAPEKSDEVFRVKGLIQQVDEHSGTSKKTKKPYTKWGILLDDGNWYTTFDRPTAEVAQSAWEMGRTIQVDYTRNGKYRDVTAVTEVDEAASGTDTF